MRAFNGITIPALKRIIQECEKLSPGQKEAFESFFEYVEELEKNE